MVIGAEVIKALSLGIFEALLKGSSKAFFQLSESFQQEVYKASKQYNRNYSARQNALKVLGMRKPIDLESVYISVRFLDNRTIQHFESIEALERNYRTSQQRNFRINNSQKKSGLDVANQTQFLMVLGGPGTGKSTFLRKTGLDALKGKSVEGFQHDCIPVFIDLKNFRFGGIDLKREIDKEFETCGFPHAKSFTTEALEEGKLLLLFDGLDEVPTERMSEIIAKMRNFIDRYDKNRFIVSCRVAAYHHNFRRFTDVEIADFDDGEIQSFIQNWFREKSQKGQECWQKLISREYTAAKELAHTPLLLTLICLLYERAGQFPTNRATLYEKALRVLLEEWSGEKGLPHEPLYRGLDTKRKELMLSKIAYDAFQQDRLFLSRRELEKQIELLLGEMLQDEQFIDGHAVLKSIEVQHGILVERAEGIYSFSHLTLQEFLTAQHIVDTRQRVEYVVSTHLGDRRWQEVFPLLAGLQQADEILSHMEKQTLSFINTFNLQSLLNWANQITTGSESPYKSSAKRAVAVFLALSIAQALALDQARVRALDLDIDRARTIALMIDPTLNIEQALDLELVRALNLDYAIGLMLNIAHKFEEIKIFKDVRFNVLIAWLKAMRVKVPKYQKSFPARKAFIEKIYQTWLKVLHLKHEWINLSRDEVSALDQYLYSNLLIIQCKNTAVWVSPKIWQEIENRMMQTIIA